MPTVSVVMAVHNGEPYLREAIDSILAQTYNEFEFNIINDGSTDKTDEIIRSYRDARIKIYSQEKKGIPASVNRGIRCSKGAYIARMDADDISEQTRFEKEVQFLNCNPDHIQVGTNASLIDEDGFYLSDLNMPAEDKDIRNSYGQKGSLPFVNGSVMYRKSAAETCGLYDERIITGQEDFALFIKMIHLGKMENLSDRLYRHRITPYGITMLPRKLSVLKMTINKRLLTGVVPTEDIKRLRSLQEKISSRQRKALYNLALGKVSIEYRWEPKCACKYFWRSISLNSWYPTTWANLAFCFMPRSWVSAWKKSRVGF